MSLKIRVYVCQNGNVYIKNDHSAANCVRIPISTGESIPLYPVVQLVFIDAPPPKEVVIFGIDASLFPSKHISTIKKHLKNPEKITIFNTQRGEVEINSI